MIDWEKAREVHKKEKEQAKKRLRKRVMEELKKYRTDMSNFGPGPELTISMLESEVILDLFKEVENDKNQLQ